MCWIDTGVVLLMMSTEGGGSRCSRMEQYVVAEDPPREELVTESLQENDSSESGDGGCISCDDIVISFPSEEDEDKVSSDEGAYYIPHESVYEELRDMELLRLLNSSVPHDGDLNTGVHVSSCMDDEVFYDDHSAGDDDVFYGETDSERDRSSSEGDMDMIGDQMIIDEIVDFDHRLLKRFSSSPCLNETTYFDETSSIGRVQLGALDLLVTEGARLLDELESVFVLGDEEFGE